MEEFIIFNLFVGLLLGFIFALVSRRRYVNRCAQLRKEIDRLQNILATYNAPFNKAANAANVLKPNTAGEAQVSQPATSVAQTSAPVSATPVATVTPAAYVAANVATPVAVTPVAATVASPVVATPAAATPVARPQAPKQKSKISAPGISLAVGIMLLIISAAVFITATWYTIDMVVKGVILLGVIAVVWAMSFVATKALKLPKIGSAFYILGMCLAPLDALAFMYDMNFTKPYLPATICIATVAIAAFVGHKIFKSKFQLGVSVCALSWVIIFLGMQIFDALVGFIVGFTVVFAAYVLISEFLPNIKIFVVASDIAAAISAVMYFITGTAIIDFMGSDKIVCIVMFILMNAMLIVYMRRHGFLKYVVPLFTAGAMPFLAYAIADYNFNGDAIGAVWATLVISLIYVVAYIFGMKLLKVPTWLSCAAMMLAVFAPVAIAFDEFYKDGGEEIIRNIIAIVFIAGTAAFSYMIRKTWFEKAIYALVATITIGITFSIMIPNDIALVVTVACIAIALGVASVVTKKIPFVYEAMTVVALWIAYSVWNSEAAVVMGLHIVGSILFATIPVWLLFRFKKNIVRDNIIAVSSAIAFCSVLSVIFKAIGIAVGDIESSYHDELFAFCTLIYVLIIYAFTALFIRFKKINEIAWDVFKYISVAGLTIAFIAFGGMLDSFRNTEPVFINYWLLLVFAAIATVVSLFETRNFATLAPVIALILSISQLIGDIPDVVVFLIAAGIIFALTFVGRIFNPRIFSSEKGLDWLTICAPFALSLAEKIGDNEGFFVWLLLAVYVATFAGRFYKGNEGETVSLMTKIKATIKPILSIIVMVLAFALASAEFLQFEAIEDYQLEISFAYILIAAALVAFVIRLPKIGKWIWFAAVAVFVHLEGLKAIMDGGNVQLIIMAVLGISIFVVSFILKNKSWFILGIETLAGIGLYLAITYWDSKLWWAYLLVAGVLLIGTATFTEIKKRSAEKALAAAAAQSGDPNAAPVKYKRFKDWTW